MCFSLSLLGTVPQRKIAQLTWPQALHYHHRRGGEGEGGYCKLSHASLTQHLSETQFFTRQRGWARGRETSEEQTMVWQLFSCLLSLAIPFARALLWGGLSQVQWAAGRWMRGESGVRCLQRRVESAPPTIEAVVEGASPAHFGSLFVSTHVAYYVNYFAGQKTTTGQDKERGRERGAGEVAWGPGILD